MRAYMHCARMTDVNRAPCGRDEIAWMVPHLSDVCVDRRWWRHSRCMQCHTIWRSVTRCLFVMVIAMRTCIDRASIRSEWKSRAGLSVLVQEMTLCDPTALRSVSQGHSFASFGYSVAGLHTSSCVFSNLYSWNRSVNKPIGSWPLWGAAIDNEVLSEPAT